MIIAIREGTVGPLKRPLQDEFLQPRVFTATIMRLGGTILGTTNKGDPFA